MLAALDSCPITAYASIRTIQDTEPEYVWMFASFLHWCNPMKINHETKSH